MDGDDEGEAPSDLHDQRKGDGARKHASDARFKARDRKDQQLSLMPHPNCRPEKQYRYRSRSRSRSPVHYMRRLRHHRQPSRFLQNMMEQSNDFCSLGSRDNFSDSDDDGAGMGGGKSVSALRGTFGAALRINNSQEVGIWEERAREVFKSVSPIFSLSSSIPNTLVKNTAMPTTTFMIHSSTIQGGMHNANGTTQEGQRQVANHANGGPVSESTGSGVPSLANSDSGGAIR